MDATKDLDLSPAEYQRISESFKNEEFRSLFMDYVKEISDPENKALYENELRSLEQEQGNDVRFVNPEPRFVVKTRDTRTLVKAFLNICTSVEIEEAQPKRAANGVHWSIPYSLGKPRDDVDHANEKCLVYDCVFHPSTFEKGEADGRFKELLISTAMEGIEKQFNVPLDKNFKIPKMKSKGPIPSTVIRSKLGKGPARPTETSSEFLTKLAQKAQEPIALKTQPEESSTKRKPVIEELPPIAPAAEDKTAPKTVSSPKYSIVHRGIINDYQKFTNAKEQQGGARPDALVIRIQLPLVESVSQIELDTLEKTLELSVPMMYKLNLDLPFPVVHDKGTAQWEKTKRELVVTLPVVPPPVMSAPSLVSDVTVEAADEATKELEEETENDLDNLKEDEEAETVIEAVLPPRQVVPLPQTRVPVFHMRQEDSRVSILMPLSGSEISDSSFDIQDTNATVSYQDDKTEFKLSLIFPNSIIKEESTLETFPTHLLLSILKSPENSSPWDFLSIQTPFRAVVQRQFTHTLSEAETRLWSDTEQVLLESRPAQVPVAETLVESIPAPVLEHAGTGADLPIARFEEIPQESKDSHDKIQLNQSKDDAVKESVGESAVKVSMPSLVFDLEDD